MSQKTETDRHIIERTDNVPAGFLFLGSEQVTKITDKGTGEKVRSSGGTREEADKNAWKDLGEANKRR